MKFKECKCIYCTTYNNFPILWKTGEHYWFEIPKNASTSLKEKYFGNTFLRTPDQYNKFLITDYDERLEGIIPIMIYRDPVDRFISLFKHYCIESGARFKKRMINFYNIYDEDIYKMSINDRLEFLLNHLMDLRTEEEVHHFYPQSTFVDTNNFEIINFVHISDVTKLFDLPVKNKTITNQTVVLSSIQKDKIIEIYNTDYELLKDVL